MIKEFKDGCDEKYVKQKVKDVLKGFPDLYWFMPAGTSFGRGGIPDIVGCYKSRFFSVECKAPARSKNLSELQKREGIKIQQAKGHWFVVYDAQTLDTFQAYLLSESLGE